LLRSARQPAQLKRGQVLQDQRLVHVRQARDVARREPLQVFPQVAGVGLEGRGEQPALDSQVREIPIHRFVELAR